MKDRPLITVILDKGVNHLTPLPAIESILDQSLGELELLILDVAIHGSTPHISSSAATDPRVSVRHVAPSIATGARINLALSNAKGKYVCMIHPNIISMRERLKTQFQFMERHTHVGAVGSISEVFKDDHILSNVWCPTTSSAINVSLLRRNCFDEFSMMFRTSYLKAAQLSYESDWKYASDYDFATKFTKLYQVRALPTEILHYSIYKKDLCFEELQLRRSFVDMVRLRTLSGFGIIPTAEETTLHLKLMENDYLTDFELIQGKRWLNLLKERNDHLGLYDRKDLTNLFENILALSKNKSGLGDWSIDKQLLRFIHDKLPAGKTILEFGSGVGTDALLRSYSVISVEDNLNYAYKHAANHTCIYSPLRDDWYRREDIVDVLTEPSDLLLVDGPKADRRSGLLKNLDLFTGNDKPVIFDDVHRPLDREVLNRFCAELGYSFQIESCGSKQFGYCVK